MLSFPSLTLRKDYYIQDCINCIRVLSFFLACLIFVLYPVLYSSESLLRTVDYKNMFYIVTNVTGSQHFSSDLVQWGSEMTCTSRLIWYDITLGLEFVGEGGGGVICQFFFNDLPSHQNHRAHHKHDSWCTRTYDCFLCFIHTSLQWFKMQVELNLSNRRVLVLPMKQVPLRIGLLQSLSNKNGTEL